jgi:hypothetical protein
MKRTLFYIAIAALSLSGAAASAQVYEELERFSEEAGEMSMLFRGKQGMSYSFPYNGTYFWYGRDFLPGDVFYNGKFYPGVLVNINAHLQELLVKEDADFLPVLVDTGHVEWFTMGGRRFVTRDYAGLGGLADGFYEVLYDGSAKLYKRVDKFLRKDSNNRNGAGIGYVDPNYNERVLDYFANRVSFYFVKDGNVRQVRKWRDILSAYPERKKELKRFAKSVRASDSAFESIAVLILQHAE